MRSMEVFKNIYIGDPMACLYANANNYIINLISARRKNRIIRSKILE